MSEERPYTRQGFFSRVFSGHDPKVPAQRESCCAASRDNPHCLDTTSADEFEPKGYGVHTVSGCVWERYSEWTHSSSHLRNAAQTKAADFSMRRVRG